MIQIWEPSQQLSWLGLDVDLQQGSISDQFHRGNLIAFVLSSELPHARLLTNLIGKLISMSLAIGPVAILITRSMYFLLNTREGLV